MSSRPITTSKKRILSIYCSPFKKSVKYNTLKPLNTAADIDQNNNNKTSENSETKSVEDSHTHRKYRHNNISGSNQYEFYKQVPLKWHSQRIINANNNNPSNHYSSTIQEYDSKERELILAYLNSSECKMFINSLKPTLINSFQSTQLKELIKACEPHTVIFILSILNQQIRERKHKINSYTNLLHEIDKIQLSLQDKRSKISLHLEATVESESEATSSLSSIANIERLAEIGGYNEIANILESIHHNVDISKTKFSSLESLITEIRQMKHKTKKQENILITMETTEARSLTESEKSDSNSPTNNIHLQTSEETIPELEAHNTLLQWLNSNACKLFEVTVRNPKRFSAAQLNEILFITSSTSLEKQNALIYPRIEDLQIGNNSPTKKLEPNTKTDNYNNEQTNKLQRKWQRLLKLEGFESFNENSDESYGSIPQHCFELIDTPKALSTRAIRLLTLMNIEFTQQFTSLNTFIDNFGLFAQQILNEKIVIYSQLFNTKEPSKLFVNNHIVVTESDIDIMFGEYSDIEEGAEEAQPVVHNDFIHSNLTQSTNIFTSSSHDYNNHNNEYRNNNPIMKRSVSGIGSTRTHEILSEFLREGKQFHSIIELIEAVLDCRYIRAWRSKQRNGILELPDRIKHKTWKLLNKHDYETHSIQHTLFYNQQINLEEIKEHLPQSSANTGKSHLIHSNNQSSTTLLLKHIGNDQNEKQENSNQQIKDHSIYHKELLNYLSYLRLFRENPVYITIPLVNQLLDSVQTPTARKKAEKLFQILQSRAKIKYNDHIKHSKSQSSNPHDFDPIFFINSNSPHKGLYGILSHLANCERIFFNFHDLISTIQSNVWSVCLANNTNHQENGNIITSNYKDTGSSSDNINAASSVNGNNNSPNNNINININSIITSNPRSTISNGNEVIMTRIDSIHIKQNMEEQLNNEILQLLETEKHY